MTTFRRAVVDDVPAIVALMADDVLGAQREGADLDVYVEAFGRVDADPGQLLAVAEDGGEVVGSLQLTFVPGLSRRGATRALVEAVRVRSDQRGRGVGADMMAWAAEQSRERGCALIQLTTAKQRTDAHRFYARLGYELTHEGFKLEL